MILRFVLRLSAAAWCLLLFGTSASAQSVDTEGAVLRGWGLPEGTVVTSATHLRRNADLHYLDPATGDTLRTLEIFTLRTDSLRTVFLEVDGDGPRQIERYVIISDILEDIHEGAAILERGRHPTPLSGTHYVAERRDDAPWMRRFLDPAQPSPEQLEALGQVRFAFDAPQYPHHRVRPGERWEVDSEVLARLHGDLVDGRPQRMTIELDSVSTYLGSPAAFLSYGLDVTVHRGDGLIVHTHEVGVIIRLLDRFVDVLSQWQGTHHTERAGEFEDGRPYRAVMEGAVRGQQQQFLIVPQRAAGM